MTKRIERQTFILSEMKGSDAYRLLIGAIIPRPIALVSTLSAQGHGNLAPFSFFTGVASEPPSLVISITPRSNGDPKDTLRNILETRQFVVNSVDEPMIQAVHQCSADYPSGVDELSQVGLTPLASTTVKPVRVAESSIQSECELFDTFQVGSGPGSSTLVVGKILVMHCSSDVIEGNRWKPAEQHPISRLAGNWYGRTSGIFELPRASLKIDSK